MKNAAFIEQLRKLQADSEEPDWDAIRTEWQDAVQKLFQQIRAWLAGPTQEGLVEINEVAIEIDEELLGRVTLPKLILRFPGHRTITISPVARVTFGALGRVDIEHGPKRVTLLRGSDGVWGALVTGARLMLQLDEQDFLGLLSTLLQ